MEYNTLYTDFKALFPEDIEKLMGLEQENGVDNTDGMHILFAFVVVPFIITLLKMSDKDKLEIAFSYLEGMETSGNSKVAEVVEFSVLENFVSEEKNFLPELKKYMGTETLKSCIKLEQFF